MQTTRQMIASGLEPVSDSLVRDWYWRQNHRVLPVAWLHLTWVPPFFAKGVTVIELTGVQAVNVEARVAGLGSFRQKGRQGLHLKLAPIDPFALAARAMEQITFMEIVVDTSMYDDDRKPPFEPHITIDYDYQGEGLPDWVLPSGVIRLKPPQLYTEKRVGEWK